MGKNIWDDDYSYLDDKDGQDYDEYIEKLEREEREHDDWLRTRYAEPGDPDYDEFDSLTSVEEYIEEHRDELTRDEIRALKEEYGIFDDAYIGSSRTISTSNTTPEKANTTPPPSTEKTVSPLIITIVCVAGFLALLWAIADLTSLLTTLGVIAVIGFFVFLFVSIFKK